MGEDFVAQDYYNILGVGRNASQEDIKRAFHRLAHQHHPDKQGGSDHRFKEINEAYQILGDTDKRAHYDRFGSAPNANGVRWEEASRNGGFDFNMGGTQGGFGDIGDIFGDIFGFGSNRRASPSRGSDVEVQITIDFRDSIFGARPVIEIGGLNTCEHCKGKGAEPGTPMTTCSTCKGNGVVGTVQQTIFGAIRSQGVCPSCGGSGERPKTACRTCKGSGSVRKKRTLKVDVPAGIKDGQSIRLHGQGEAGPRGSTAGDLYVRIRVRPDEMFRRDGDDLITRRIIGFNQAALGDDISVKTVDGEVSLHVPAGTQPGKLFRLRGKGVPRINANGRGDQIVEIVVQIPERLSREQRKILEQFKETE